VLASFIDKKPLGLLQAAFNPLSLESSSASSRLEELQDASAIEALSHVRDLDKATLVRIGLKVCFCFLRRVFEPARHTEIASVQLICNLFCRKYQSRATEGMSENFDFPLYGILGGGPSL
jgi:hypothetical protein